MRVQLRETKPEIGRTIAVSLVVSQDRKTLRLTTPCSEYSDYHLPSCRSILQGDNQYEAVEYLPNWGMSWLGPHQISLATLELLRTHLTNLRRVTLVFDEIRDFVHIDDSCYSKRPIATDVPIGCPGLSGRNYLQQLSQIVNLSHLELHFHLNSRDTGFLSHEVGAAAASFLYKRITPGSPHAQLEQLTVFFWPFPKRTNLGYYGFPVKKWSDDCRNATFTCTPSAPNADGNNFRVTCHRSHKVTYDGIRVGKTPISARGFLTSWRAKLG